MSPEQKHDPESTSYPSDIYSLGIITYELVLGKLSHGYLHLAIMPKGLQKILAKALRQDPSERYQDVVDFMTDVSAYLHSPALLKENRELDPLSDLSESLRQAQYSLIPQTPPYWPGIDVGLATYKSLGSTSLYYDFFTLPGHIHGIIIGEPSVKGSPGIVYSSVLRGMVRALSQLTQHPEQMATVLNALLLNDPMKQHFSFSYLVLLPRENSCRFISCQCGHLWHRSSSTSLNLQTIPSDNPSLGANPDARFVETEHHWRIGDNLIFYASLGVSPLTKDPLFSADQLQISLEETLHASSQKQVDAILRKAKITLSRTTDQRSVVLLSLMRKE